jgi:3-deoxy-D-manno-octulosonate 8-phosphate phosphatase (KDO 8-P phosphatase)
MGSDSAQLSSSLAAVRLVALDVDGVLTDGRVVFSGAVEVQHFHVHDGAAIVWLQRAGITVAWISGRGCAATEARAKELGVRELHLRSGPKLAVLRELQLRLGLGAEQTLAMGDDLADLELFAIAAVSVAPANARADVRARADIVTLAGGGQGAVREMAERLLRARNAWDALVAGAGAAKG